MQLSEFEKMKNNLPFNPADPELIAIRTKMREVELLFNQTKRSEMNRRAELLNMVLESFGNNSLISPGFHMDYGCNITIKNDVFINVNVTFIDVANITIEDRVLIGPNVIICTATHPILASERQAVNDKGAAYTLEYSHPIHIEEDVWIGAGAIINPGVTIGKGSVIGSGSVVTKDIPQGVVAVGNPCRVLRKITEKDGLAVKGY